MPLGDELLHVAVEEGQQNGADVRPVLIGVREDDDLVVLEPRQREILVDVRSQRRDDGAELLVAKHLIQALFLGVERLSAQRQNRLKPPVAPLLGAAARAVALHDEQFVLLRLSPRAAGQLSHQRRGLQRALGARHVAALRAASRTFAARTAFSMICWASS